MSGARAGLLLTQAGLEALGTPDGSLFDFPVLPPNASITTQFLAGVSGLFAFT